LDIEGFDGETHSGFLKHDIKIKTPYGNMVAMAIGRLSGYFSDFSYYVNGNIYVFWPRKRVNIKVNGIDIVVSACTENDVALEISFHKNFTLESCFAANPVNINGVSLPCRSWLNFSDDENLESFVITDRWTFSDVEYMPYQRFDIINNEIIPK
jgi:hypothetical protein